MEIDQLPHNTVIIQGITEDGMIFRPSDWAERLCGGYCTLKNRRVVYSPQLCPSVWEGIKCVLLDTALEESNPELYASVMAFVKANRLQTRRVP